MKVFKLQDGKEIKEGDVIIYKNGTYVVWNVDKDNVGWIARPCGTTDGPDIKLTDIPEQLIKTV